MVLISLKSLNATPGTSIMTGNLKSLPLAKDLRFVLKHDEILPAVCKLLFIRYSGRWFFEDLLLIKKSS
jgi:hypothetical protein